MALSPYSLQKMTALCFETLGCMKSLVRIMILPSNIFLICIFLSVIWVAAKPKVYIKLTNAHCESFNKSWVVINECRLRAIKRDVTALNINITFLHPADDIKLSIAYLKKANGYKPFVLNSTLDACEYIHKKNNPIANLVYSFFIPFSNINHTCPYVGDQIVKNLYPKNEIVTLILPMGDYVVMLSWFLSKRKTFVTNVYFTFNG